jgi:hypothetical protein
VLERLSRHGPASWDVHRRDAGDGRPHGLWRRRHAQHFRHQPSAGRARAELADLHGKEAALVFTSGFVSNEAAISTIARLLPNCLILSDEFNHASMIEGVRRSGAEKKVFRHNDVRASGKPSAGGGPRARQADRVRIRLFDGWRHRADRRRSPIWPKYNAMTYIDEVHAVGMYGRAAAALPSARAWRTESTSSRARWPRRSARWAATSPARAPSSTPCAPMRRASSSPPRCRRPSRPRRRRRSAT